MKVALRIEGRKKHARWNFTVELMCECIFAPSVHRLSFEFKQNGLPNKSDEKLHWCREKNYEEKERHDSV